MTDRTLILITNDDGIESFGLHAAIVACAPLGDLLVVAPSSQQTAAGRSKPNASACKCRSPSSRYTTNRMARSHTVFLTPCCRKIVPILATLY